MSQTSLDNIAWLSLSGILAPHTVGNDRARRLVRGAPPIAAFSDRLRPEFSALEPHCDPGEPLYCAGWSGRAPVGWEISSEAPMMLMVWDGACPPESEIADNIEVSAQSLKMIPDAIEHSAQIVTLGDDHVDAAMDLVRRADYGPFGPKSLALGSFLGIVEHGRLVALAGERFADGAWREICSVCTDPAARGRGHATRLTTSLVRRHQRQRLQSCLHVMADNTVARNMYKRLGFRELGSTTARVVMRQAT